MWQALGRFYRTIDMAYSDIVATYQGIPLLGIEITENGMTVFMDDGECMRCEMLRKIRFEEDTIRGGGA